MSLIKIISIVLNINYSVIVLSEVFTISDQCRVQKCYTSSQTVSVSVV